MFNSLSSSRHNDIDSVNPEAPKLEYLCLLKFFVDFLSLPPPHSELWQISLKQTSPSSSSTY